MPPLVGERLDRALDVLLDGLADDLRLDYHATSDPNRRRGVLELAAGYDAVRGERLVESLTEQEGAG